MSGPNEGEIRKAATVLIEAGLSINGWDDIDGNSILLQSPDAVVKYVAMQDAIFDFSTTQEKDLDAEKKAAAR